MSDTLKLRMCEICQQTKHIEDLSKMIEIIDKCTAVEKYAYIVHNQDIDIEGKLKAEHVHIMIKFSYSYNVFALAKLLNLSSQYIQKIQSRNYEDALLYLIHANAQEKFQYASDLVKANFDYKSICEQYQRQKATASSNIKESERVKLICEEIITGKIKRYNYFDLIDSDICIRYRTRIESAFKVRDDMLKTQERSLEVMYFTGDSGTGKTTLAKQIAKNKGYSYYISSASNDVLDSYAGQDCLILDDLRPSCLSLSDLLKLLDNHTASTAKSRYYNKTLECKLIIITSVIDLEDFFSKVFQEQSEPLIQLKRRCKTYFEFTKHNIEVSKYDDTAQDYKHIETIRNPVADLYPVIPLNTESVTEELHSLLGDAYIKVPNEDWINTEISPFN